MQRLSWVIATTFLFACSSPPPPPPPPSAPTTVTLKITSDPTGATVLLDGNPGCSPTPCEIQNVAFGGRTLLFQHPEYEDLERKVKVSSDTPEISAPLKTESKPKAAGKVKLVFENEKPNKVKPQLEVSISGSTDLLVLSDALEIELAPGKRSLEIRRAGYAPITKEIDLAAGGTLDISIVKADQVGAKLTLLVDSNPVKGKVFINGQDKGTAPVTVADLDASKAYAVLIKAPDYEDFTTGAKWIKGPYELKINATLEKAGANGFLIVDTKPLTGLAVYIDGKKSKYTTPVSAPGIKLPAGPHTISFEAGAKKSADVSFTIEENKTLTKVFKSP